MRKSWIAIAGMTGALTLGTWTFGTRAMAQATDNPPAAANMPPNPPPPPDHPDGPGGPRPLGRLIRAEIGRWMTLTAELDVTPDQHRQIHHILQSHHQEILTVAKSLVEKHRAVRDAVTAPNPDEQAIRAAADAMGHAIGDAAVLASKIKQEVAAVLTDKQRQQLTDFRAQTDQAVDDFFTQMSTMGQGNHDGPGGEHGDRGDHGGPGGPGGQ